MRVSAVRFLIPLQKNGYSNLIILSALEEGSTTILAMSATPQKIRERFGELCRDVPYDSSELIRLETFSRVPYYEKVENILNKKKGKTGILYTTKIEDMKRYIDYANSIGIRANGFWSLSAAKHPLSMEQLALRETVLSDETIPDDIDLLVINRASETCIKIQGEKRKVDYIIIHDCNEEIQTQVRGRYHGDLPEFYYHNNTNTNLEKVKQHPLPDSFLNRRLYSEDWDDIQWELNLLRPDGKHYGTPTIIKYLRKCGYCVSDPQKDRKHKGKYFRIISKDGTNSGFPLKE